MIVFYLISHAEDEVMKDYVTKNSDKEFIKADSLEKLYTDICSQVVNEINIQYLGILKFLLKMRSKIRHIVTV